MGIGHPTKITQQNAQLCSSMANKYIYQSKECHSSQLMSLICQIRFITMGTKNTSEIIRRATSSVIYGRFYISMRMRNLCTAKYCLCTATYCHHTTGVLRRTSKTAKCTSWYFFILPGISKEVQVFP